MDDAILTSYQPLTQHKKIGQTHNPESMILLVCCCVFHITWDINVRHLFLRLHCTFFWYVSFVGKAVALWLYYPTGLLIKSFPLDISPSHDKDTFFHSATLHPEYKWEGETLQGTVVLSRGK